MNILKKLTPFSIRVTPKGVMWVLLWTVAMMVCELLSLLESFKWLVWAVKGLLVLGVGIVIVFLWEYARLIMAVRVMNGMGVYRTTDSNLPVYEVSKVALSVCHENLPEKLTNFVFTVMDYYPDNTKAQGLPATFLGHQLANQNSQSTKQDITLVYELYANERGFGAFGGVDWLISTPLGLLMKFYHTPKSVVGGVQDVRILANFKALVRGNLLAVSKNSSVSGMIKRRRKGQGQDFHQIRSYSEGDSIRHIDWKATARHQRLMSKEYQDEADQEILFLLDCGQHMRHVRFGDETKLQKKHDDKRLDDTINPKISHLDMALNAMLLLAQAANRQADATGFISFGANINKTAPPKKGTQVISYLLNQSFDLKASMNAPDYMAVARQALSMQRRRSLLIMITNIRTDNSEEIMAALQLLTQKHRVILVNLYESDLKDYLAELPETADDALTYHSVKSYLDAQKRLNIRLGEETGAMVVGSTPQELPSKLLDSYWLARRWGVV